jgi:TRAP-type C4-dicarboxylate transport system permease small subunit
LKNHRRIHAGRSVSQSFAQIFSRALGWSVVWTEESSRFLFIWIIFLGISAGIKYDSHIGTNVFVNLLPMRLRKPASILNVILFLSFTCYMTKLSLSLLSMQLQFKQYTPATGIPGYLISAALPVGFILTSVRLVFKLIRTLTGPASDREDPASIQKTEAY